MTMITRRARWSLVLATSSLIALGWAAFATSPPQLIYNASDSVPTGWYRIAPVSSLVTGDLVLVRLPPDAMVLAARRGYLPSTVPLLKTVAAIAPQQVCVRSNYVLVDGQRVSGGIFDFALFPTPLEYDAATGATTSLFGTEGAIATFIPEGMEVLDPFALPLLNTLILLCSGTTVTWAHHALIHGDRTALKQGLWATIALGVLFSSIQAYDPSVSLIDYASTKAAIQNLTRGLAKQLAKKGIRVNAVSPGPIWTPLIPATMPDEAVRNFGSGYPMGRPGQPVEVAPIYVLLGSDEASYISGSRYAVTGGKPIL